MDTDRPRHLVSVWNPDYAVDAMDAHVSVLWSAHGRTGGGEIAEEEVHVWWGRIRSARRQEELPHLADVLALDDQIERRCPPTST